MAMAVVLTLPWGAFAQSWVATNIYNNWTSLAITADGSMIAAGSFLGGIYTSTDGGTNWMAAGSPDSSHLPVLAASTNGGNLYAAFFGGGIYGSTNWGTNWTPSSAQVDNWNCLAASADGTRLVAGPSPGMLYSSKDSGTTFTSRLPQNNAYQAVAGSADGSNLMAIAQGGRIYRSTDLGDTWSATPAPVGYWSGVTVSSNGMNVAAVVQGGGIYTSADSGATWNVTSAPGTNWSAVAGSADGSILVAAANGGTYYGGGLIYVSTDSGADWTATIAPLNYWSQLYCSPDGTVMFALANNGSGAYFSTNSGVAWNEEFLNNIPGNTNVVCSDIFQLSVIVTNLSTGKVTGTNYFDYTNLLSFPGVRVSAGTVSITNTSGFNLTVTNVLGNVQKMTALLGINVQGATGTGVGPISTTNLLGSTGLGRNKTIATNLSILNSVATSVSIPNGVGSTSTNFVSVFMTNLTGLQVAITNTMNARLEVGNNALQTWSGLTASADGSRLEAADNGGFIYSSTNLGSTWTTNAGLISVSSNAGISWLKTNSVSSPKQYWSALASSADGSRLVASVANGCIFTSTNSGVTWVSNNSNNVPWQIADGEIPTSSNSSWETRGTVWMSNSVPGQTWSAVYSSPDGNTLLALARSGWSYKSTNGGATWYELSAPYDLWQSVASSASGSDLLAASKSGYVYLSTNAGINWNELCIVPGTTNINSTDVLILSDTYTNLNRSGINAGRVGTDILSSLVTILPSMVISSNSVMITGTLGIQVTGTTLVGTNAVELAALLGISEQGSNVFGLSPVCNDSLGTNVLGVGTTVPSSGVSSVFIANVAVPDGTGIFNSDGAVNTNLIQTINTNLSGINVTITNILNVEVVVTNTSQNWSSVAVSADASHLAAAVNGGPIYLSTNSGAAWFASSAPNENWSAIAMSSDGSQLTAAVNGGVIYTSSDSGATWQAANVPASNWSAVAISANGADLVAVVDGGVLYTSQNPLVSNVGSAPQPSLQIQVTAGNVTLSWPLAATGFVLQQDADLSGNSWTDVSTTPVVTNGQIQVTVSLTSGNCLYRLRR